MDKKSTSAILRAVRGIHEFPSETQCSTITLPPLASHMGSTPKSRMVAKGLRTSIPALLKHPAFPSRSEVEGFDDAGERSPAEKQHVIGGISTFQPLAGS